MPTQFLTRDHSAKPPTPHTSPATPPPPRWIDLADLTRAAADLAAQLPADTVAVAGVSRSGLPAASLVAMIRHLPLAIISPQGLYPCPAGWRLNTPWPEAGRLAVIDDTICTGASLHKLRHQLANLRETRPVTVAVGYATPEARHLVDLAARELPRPHLLAWNLANSVYTPRLALDFDGVISHEIPLADCDEPRGGHRYRAAIETVAPLWPPRRGPVTLIVTGRPRAYERHTRAWLARHGIEARQIEFWPGDPAKRFTPGPEPVAKFKAYHYRKTPAAALFVESCPHQAAMIAQRSGKATLCPTTGQIWGRPEL